MQQQTNKVSIEFVALMASLMSIVALAIDALLPALSIIGRELKTSVTTDNQLLITMIFLGLGFGQLLFGPLSDSFGRKPIVYFGFIIFLIASIVCIYAETLTIMVVGRILQGIGLSAPRTVSISIIRDSYKGDYMAKIMSFVTVVFILVPIIAPALGKFILNIYSWQAIFYAQLIFAAIIGIWFWKRQKETLKTEFKVKFSSHLFVDGLKELIKFQETIAFTLISGFITGAFLVYLSASQQIFEIQYGLGDAFPYIFAGLAITVGLATFLNGTLVMRFGMRNLAFYALIAYCIISIIYVVIFWSQANPCIEVLLIFLGLQFFALGFLFGNLRSIAMEPVGHIAGIGAAITGFISTLLAVPIGTYIGKFVTTTVHPVFFGFAICGIISLLIFIAFKDKRTHRLE
ncbi:MAG: multidrug effflux MFS transporter [Flavobacteriaceae bacterium]|nr:multidrug effflux MFS transporter [Flavobacteriaceae bacterium]